MRGNKYCLPFKRRQRCDMMACFRKREGEKNKERAMGNNLISRGLLTKIREQRQAGCCEEEVSPGD